MTTPPRPDFDALAVIIETATPGPWDVRTGSAYLSWCVMDPRNVTIATCKDSLDGADARLIAAARTALPALVAEVRRLEGERDACEQSRSNEHATAMRTCERLAAEVERLEAEVARLRVETPTMFRVMGGFPAVPWRLIAPYEYQAQANHDQTLLRLHERGGLTPRELWAVVHAKRWSQAPDEATVRAWFDTWRRGDA